jgi:tol-pal system protein YbgF
MRRLVFWVIVNALIWQTASAGINVDQAIIGQNQKIKLLTYKNKVLRGRIDQLERNQQQSSQKITELFSLLKFKKAEAKIVAEKTLTPILKPNQDAKKIYINARSLLVTDQYNQAIALFTQYLNDYPNNRYAPDARYWLAKTYFITQRYELAQKTFATFQQNNPTHYKYPNSLFELSKVYAELGQSEASKVLLNRILDKFSTHSVVNQAKQLLTKLTPKSIPKKSIKIELKQ